MAYFAIPVPKEVTDALCTHGPVPVSAQVNGSEAFFGSLYPVGGGRHYLRVKNKICSAVQIKEGDPVLVQITVRDRFAEVTVPEDLRQALQAAGLVEAFQALPIGQRSFLLRRLAEAAKPETRHKRIETVLDAARRREATKT
jgi:hypothetical protein